MKKILATVLLIAMAIVCVACGNSSQNSEQQVEEKGESVFDISKKAYERISSAYDIAEEMSEDVYEAWRLGIYEDDDISVSLLAAELNLTYDELVDGYGFLTDKENASDMDVNRYLKGGSSVFSRCVWLVTGAYEANGKKAIAETALEEAKTDMKKLSEQHSDYEHYPNLKGFYTTTRSLLGFCLSPDGTFEQVKTTINEYRNEIRDYIADLDYIFED